MTRKYLFILTISATLAACDQGPDVDGNDLDGYFQPADTGKADSVSQEFVVRGHRVIVFGDAGQDLYRAFDASGGFAAYSSGGVDYLSGRYTICASNGTAAACVLYARAAAGNDTLAFTVHGRRFDSAPSEIFGALAAASGISPAQTSRVDSHRFVCAKSAYDVWCGLRTAMRLRIRIDNVAAYTHLESGAFAVPVGAGGPGPLAPGDAYEVSFTAGPMHRLSFATMFGQSNDWFFAPDPSGLALYNGDQPISGDVTDQIRLWDAGTEVDEEPAVGPHTGPRQSSSTDGPGAPDANPEVRVVPGVVTLADGSTFSVPAVADMIRVTITSDDPATRRFTLRIENVADDSMTLVTSQGPKPVRVSPGVWAVGGDEPLFSAGQPDRGLGLEEIAEGGNVAPLAAALSATAGVATPVSPGVLVLHRSGKPLFSEGDDDRGLGLQNIAEQGDVSVLAESLSQALPDGASSFAVFNTPVGATGPGPIRPGDSYELEVIAVPGDRLSFAAMYGASNDWIFATPDDGIELFSGSTPRSGDVTGEIGLWDVGTELSEQPAVGPHIGAPRGAADPDTRVRLVPSSDYPASVADHIHVTIQ